MRSNGCALIAKAAKTLIQGKAPTPPWEAKTNALAASAGKTNAKTLAYISKVLSITHVASGRKFTDGFWLVIVARDLESVMGKEVFDSSTCAKLGENGRNGLNEILPKVKATRQKLRQYNTDGNRLQLLTTEMDKRVSEMLGSELLELLPPIKNLQVTEHNCCEHMQQNCRKRLQEGTSRRSDPELRRFYKAALHRLGLAGDSERLISLLGSLQDDPPDEFLTDAEVLERLRIALPQAHGPMGWSKQAVASYFEQK